MGLSTSTKTFAERLEESKKTSLQKLQLHKHKMLNGTNEKQHVMN